MGSNWVGLLVAVVGVAGTLGAALLTQNRADRTKRMELEAAARQRREERDHAGDLLKAEQAVQRQREGLERRRTCYIKLNIASRLYVTEMTNYLHALRSGQDVDVALSSLEAARLAHRESYAESQMISPDVVLRPSGAAKSALNAAYGKLRTYGAAPATYAEELANLERVFQADVWPYLGALRKTMRDDLGIEG